MNETSSKPVPAATIKRKGQKAHVPVRLWGLLALRRNRRGEMVLRPMWKRIGVLLGILFLLIAVGGYVALFAFFRYGRGWDFIGFTDVSLLALNPPEFRRKVGDEQFRQAKQFLEEKKYREAVAYAQQATARSPANKDARVLFSQMLVSMLNRPDRATKLLFDGLKYDNYDDDYIRLMLEIMAYSEDDDSVVELYEFVRDQSADKGDVYLYLQLAAANAHFNRGRFTEALKMLDEVDPRLQLQAEVLRGRIEWERGYLAEALQRLEDLYQRSGTERSRVAALLVNYYRDIGRIKDAWGLGLQRVLDMPNDPEARVDYLLTLYEMGDRDGMKRQLDLILKGGKPDSRSLDLLMMLAIRTANYDLGKSVYDTETRVGGNPLERGLRFAELNIVCGRYQDALDVLVSVEAAANGVPSGMTHFFNGLKAVAYQGLSQLDQRDVFLNRFLEHPGLRPAHYSAVATRFMDMQAYSAAERVLSHALLRMFPNNRTILTQRLNLYLARPDDQLIADLASLLEQRRLSRDLLLRSYSELAKDRFLFYPSRNAVLDRLEQILEDYRQG